MRIGVSTGNFRTVSAHAGRARRYLAYTVGADGTVTAETPLQLPTGMTVHDFHGRGPHPLDSFDLILTNGCGQGYINRLRSRGVRVLLTPERDPTTAIARVLDGSLTETTMNTSLVMNCHGDHGRSSS